MQNPLMVENAISKHTNLLPAEVQLGQIALVFRRMNKHSFGQKMADPVAGVQLIEKSRPKPEVQLRHHLARRDRLAVFHQTRLGLPDPFHLPSWQTRDRVVPSNCAMTTGKRRMDAIPQGDLRILERGIKCLAQRHIQ